MFEIMLNTNAQLIRWGLPTLSILLLVSTYVYVWTYYIDHFSAKRALIQTFPIMLTGFVNLGSFELDKQLRQYSEAQLSTSNLILDYSLRIHKDKKIIGTVQCKKVTIKECILKIKNNQEAIEYR